MKKLLIIAVLLIVTVVVMHFKAEAYVVDTHKGTCRPRAEDPQTFVCVVTEGTKNCSKDSDCVMP